ncbi:hypothetical protein [Desulfurivibrio alkaliphilus]|uniref:Lipoprotein n=1 Tax=Desulfurivibrio alkaliphilus (strain DSM 19089 / UNIQEM U267 / AHT2) TaxID=589865 RepID=D6Z247_DESAT|nr:hypothetical protein [Desulfurivibrio alkaliphilus]ADH85622.1 hypothetical protein DaAHT2_0918 [Desulfurivibrio alkaliphilus AHT 2]
MQLHQGRAGLWGLAVLLGLSLLLVGCSGDKSSEEACRYDAIMALNKGNYDRALNLLDKSACRSAFSEDELLLNRAAAYIGRAGYDILDLVKEIVNADDDDDTKTDARLIEAFAERASGGGMNDLDRATSAYRKMLLDEALLGDTIRAACKESEQRNLSDFQKDACFNNGLLAAAKAAATFSLLFGGSEGLDELKAWLAKSDDLECKVDRNQDGKADQGQITSCALKVAKDPSDDCGSASIAGERGAAINFTPENTDSLELIPVRVEIAIDNTCLAEVSGQTGVVGDKFIRYRMLSEVTAGSYTAAIVDTEGFCQADMTPCDSPDYAAAIANNTCWPCPVINDEGKLITITDTLVTALNEDVDSLVAMLPKDEQEEVQEDLDEFRAEICGAPCDEITEDMIIDYLLR